MDPKEYQPFTPGEGEVVDFGMEGEGIVKDLGFPVFVPGALIGDRISYRLIQRRKKIWRGELNRILNPSPNRIPSPCKYFPKCGGCQLLNYKYSGQLKAKRKKVEEVLRRIGKVNNVLVEKVIPSEEIFHYRNHLQCKVVNGKIGFYASNSKEHVPITTCKIAGENTNALIKKLQDHRELKDLTQVSFRENSYGEVMIIYSTKKNQKIKNNLLASLIEPYVTSIYQGMEAKGKGHFEKNFTLIYKKKEFQEELLGNQYVISPGSFFQVNKKQGERLYQLAIDALNPDLKKEYLDLYCGIGSMTIPLAQKSKHVVGIEYIEEAVEAARENGNINKVTNLSFAHGKVESLLEEVLKEKKYEGCILDPPRGGCNKKVLEALVENPIKRLVYVSCNPSTWARDIQRLVAGGYELEYVQPVDMFCHSMHIELVSRLSHSNHGKGL